MLHKVYSKGYSLVTYRFLLGLKFLKQLIMLTYTKQEKYAVEN